MSEQFDHSDASSSSGFLRRFFGSLPVLIVLLLLWAVVLVWGVGAFALHQRPDLVRDRVNALLAKHCPSVTLSMGAMRPSLWPSPGLRVRDVLLRDKGGSTLLADACELHFGWSDLLSGNVAPDRVLLDNASARIVLPAPEAPLETTTSSPALRALSAVSALNGMTVELSNTAFQVISPDGLDVRMKGLSGTFTAPSGEAAGLIGLEPGELALRWTELSLQGGAVPLQGGAVPLQGGAVPLQGGAVPLQGGALRLQEEALQGWPLRLRDARIDAKAIRLNRNALTNDAKLAPGLIRTGEVNFSVLAEVGNPEHPVLRDARINFKAALALTAGPPDIHGELNLSGNWQINGVSVPVKGTLPFGSRDVRTGVDIVDAVLHMDNNEARCTATLLPDDLSLTGRIDVERFSLPRWFAFARSLPDSLADTLDAIRGSFTFRLTPQGLTVPDLKFTLSDMPFAGSAGVDDWAKPVIRIDAQTDAADINRIFPELADKPGAKPTFSGPPVLPGPVPPSPANMGPGFLIRLKAKDATFWKCAGKGFSLELSPIWSGNGREVDGVKLDSRLEQFYGGKLEARLLANDNLHLTLNTRNVNGEKLSRATAGSFGGTLQAEADFKSSGNDLVDLLAGLKGSLNATLHGGFFTVNARKIPFERFVVRADQIFGTSRPGSVMPPRLTYTGQWHTELTPPKKPQSTDPKPLRLTLDATGPLRFSTDFWLPVAAQNLPVRATGILSGTPFALTGTVTAALADTRLTVANLSGRVAEADVNGDLVFTPPNAVHGTVSASTSDLRGLLARLDVSLNTWPQTAFRRADLRAEVDWRAPVLQLSAMHGALDETGFSGKLRVENGLKWSGDLALSELDMSRYRPPATPTTSATPTPAPPTTPSTPKSSTPWPTALLKQLDLNGEVRVGRLQMLDILADDCRLPIRLKNGRLGVSPMTARIGKAPQQASLNAEILDNAISLQFSSTIRNADMLSVWKSAGSADLLGGFGNSNLNLYGVSRSSADIPACLSGTWTGNIQNGFISTGSSRRAFHSLSASGRMDAGVLESKDFLLNGQNFSVRGGGKVNLVNRTLNYKLTASLPGVPAIPITYRGSLSDPKRNINALSTVASVLGNVGKGVFSLLDSVLSAPLKFLN